MPYERLKSLPDVEKYLKPGITFALLDKIAYAQSDNEFAASMVTLGNSVLDMSYGTINPNIISPCTWLGKIRSESRFTVQQAHSWSLLNFHDGIFVKLAGTTGTSEFMNINGAPNHCMENNGTATFNMSYSIASTGTGDFQGLGELLSIQIYKQNDPDFTWEATGKAAQLASDAGLRQPAAVAHK